MAIVKSIVPDGVSYERVHLKSGEVDEHKVAARITRVVIECDVVGEGAEKRAPMLDADGRPAVDDHGEPATRLIWTAREVALDKAKRALFRDLGICLEGPSVFVPLPVAEVPAPPVDVPQPPDEGEPEHRRVARGKR